MLIAAVLTFDRFQHFHLCMFYHCVISLALAATTSEFTIFHQDWKCICCSY